MASTPHLTAFITHALALLLNTHVCKLAYLHHLGWIIHCPNYELLPGLLALTPESDMTVVRRSPPEPRH